MSEVYACLLKDENCQCPIGKNPETKITINFHEEMQRLEDVIIEVILNASS